MTISKSQHKALLVRRFYVDGQERSFPLEKLIPASSSLSKLMAGSETIDRGLLFTDGPVEFNIDEAKFLKDLVFEVKAATISEFQFLKELKEILQ